MSDPVFTADWFSQNVPALTEVLAKFKGKPDIHALEIGCFEGMGTLWMLNNILTGENSTIDCIDTFQGSSEHAHFGIPFTETQDRFHSNLVGHKKHRLYSTDPSSMALRRIVWSYEIILVDASHMAVDVLSDLVLSWPLLKPGGVMFCDDYEWPGTDGNALHTPKPAITAFLNIYSEQLKVLHMGYSVAIEKL